MSGIIFNGVEMKKGEDQKAYINRVLKEMDIDDDVSESETGDDVSESETSTDDDSSDTEIEETDSKHVFEFYKNVMLGTYDCSMEEHDDAVRWFNEKYGTTERGSNGSKGHYFTHGETKYNLFKLQKLKSLYDRDIKAVYIYNVKIHIGFLNEKSDQELKRIQEDTNLINNFRSQRDADRFIEIKKCRDFMKILNIPDIEIKRDYNHSKTTHKHKFKVGDAVFYNSNPYLHYVVFWQIVKITNKRIKVRPLKPIITIKHNTNENNKAFLVKYKKGDFITEDIKSKYLKPTDHNTVYIIEDYIYRVFKETY
jgi:hypothetical protein